MKFYQLNYCAVNVETPKGIQLGFMKKVNGKIEMINEWFPKRFIIFLEDMNLNPNIRFRFKVILSDWLAKKIHQKNNQWMKMHRAKPIDFPDILYNSTDGIYTSRTYNWLYTGVSIIKKSEEIEEITFKKAAEDLSREEKLRNLRASFKEKLDEKKQKKEETPLDRAIIL